MTASIARRAVIRSPRTDRSAGARTESGHGARASRGRWLPRALLDLREIGLGLSRSRDRPGHPSAPIDNQPPRQSKGKGSTGIVHTRPASGPCQEGRDRAHGRATCGWRTAIVLAAEVSRLVLWTRPARPPPRPVPCPTDPDGAGMYEQYFDALEGILARSASANVENPLQGGRHRRRHGRMRRLDPCLRQRSPPSARMELAGPGRGLACVQVSPIPGTQGGDAGGYAATLLRDQPAGGSANACRDSANSCDPSSPIEVALAGETLASGVWPHGALTSAGAYPASIRRDSACATSPTSSRDTCGAAG